MTKAPLRTVKTASKALLRKLVPNYLLQERAIVQRLGPLAGRIYAGSRVLDSLGIRTEKRRLAPSSARSVLFVCFGNIMRSAMAEFLMRKELSEAGLTEQVRIMSAGLHATAGKEAHPWAQDAAANLGVSLQEHRAKLLTREMVEQADCVFAMDFQNKAELLTLYPEAQEKICMLSAYGEGAWQYREISDPYHQDLESTRVCAQQLRTCIRNLIAATLLSSATAKEPVTTR